MAPAHLGFVAFPGVALLPGDRCHTPVITGMSLPGRIGR